MRRSAQLLVAMLVVVSTLAGAALSAGATVRLTNGKTPGHDQLMFHGRLGSTPGRSVVTTGMTLDMYNDAHELFAEFVMPDGKCAEHAGFCQYRDQNAQRTKTGIALFKMQFDVGKIWLTAYGDLSHATRNMTIVVTINGRGYSLVHAFKKTNNGWALTNDQW